MKHIKDFQSLVAAKAATLYSPLVVNVTDSGTSKMLIKSDGDKEMQIDQSITDINNLSSDNVIPKQTGPEMVDLGLPSGTLWAKVNIGAATETAAGKYFAWGDAEGFEASEVSGTMFSSSWYATRPGYELNSDIEDDDEDHNAAFAAYGPGYTMPSDSDFQELIDETENEWVQNYNGSGVSGFVFTGNNNTLFIPAAGYGGNGSISGVGGVGDCWGSTYRNSDFAYNLYFSNRGYILVSGDDRYRGFSVRAIQKQSTL